MGPAAIEGPCLVLGEGKDEEVLLNALIRYAGLPHAQAMGIAGKDNLRQRLELLRKTPGFDGVRSIGILRDADEDRAGAFQSVCSALRNAGFSVPEAELSPSTGRPRIVVLIVAGGDGTGATENVCLDTVRADPAMVCVDQYFACLLAAGIPPRQRASAVAKARVQAFLASRSVEVRDVGTAAQKELWDLASPAFDPVIQLLRLL